MKKAAIIYYSASGNTEKVSGWLRQDIIKKGLSVSSYTIPEIRGCLPQDVREADIIFIGTPTYMWHTPKIVKDFLRSIEFKKGTPVGLFVTFGSVTVGSNISSMAGTVRKKGGRVVGAMQIEGEHAMMFKGDAPLAQGKPGPEDRSAVKEFADLCLERAAKPGCSLKKFPNVMKHFSFLCPPSIAMRFMPGIKHSMETCTLCGTCVESCPVNNIVIDEGILRHGSECLYCYNCVRVCPTGAVDANLISMEGGLRLMSRLPEKERALY